MPLTDSIPFVWRPRGLTDAIDGTNAFNGAMASLSNLIPDPSTESVWMPRPPALSVTTFSSFTTPGFISAIKTIGNRVYGLIASGANAGHDEPFCYDLLANTFVTISGITSANTPTSPATSGAWTPPIIEQVGSRIVVTHPGFPGGQTKFGWFDISGYNQTTVGDVVNGSPIITGNPAILGVQPGMTVAGTNIAGGATVLFAQDAYTATAFTGTSHGTFTIDGIASTAALLPGYFLVGPGIPPSTIIEQVLANSIIISFATTSSVTATFYAYGANPSIAGGYVGTTTAGNATVTTASTLGLWVGQSVVGVNIPFGSVIVSLVANTSITLNQAALGSGTQGFQVSGTVVVMSANATGTSNGGAITIAGGTSAAPQWGAGDTQPNNLPRAPVGVAQMAGRAYFALGTDGIVFSDSGFPCLVSNITRVQALRTNDGLAITAIGPVMLATLTGGIVQCLIAFEGATKMQQITGDAATNNLAMNALPVATGTNAPLTVTPMELGLSFVSPEGLRIVEFSGRVTPPLGDHGMGVTTPFIYTVVPSRMCSAAASDTIRVTTQNGYKTSHPQEEYWYDLTRTVDGRNKVWHGPHTSTASLIEAWNDQFVMTFIGTNAALFVSPASPVASSTYIENGNQLVWQYEPVYLMPDNEQMSMNSLVEMTLACGGPNCSVLAPPEPLLYGPPLIGGPPVQPGPGPEGTPLVPNQPPPPPTQPIVPTPCIYAHPTVLSMLPAGTQALAQGVSSDGTIIVGQADAFAVTWTSGGAPVALPYPASGGPWVAAFASCCSSDGTIIGGAAQRNTGSYHPVVWTGGVAAVLAFPGTGDQGAILDCSDNGSVFVGRSSVTVGGQLHPVKWSGVGLTPTDLGLPGILITGQALGCDSTADIIVGWCGDGTAFAHTACYWDGTGVHTLPFITSGTFAEAYDCTSDGSVIVGRSSDVRGTGFRQAVTWSGSPTITVHPLPYLAGGGSVAVAYGINPAGNLIVGFSDHGMAFNSATLWTSGIPAMLGDQPNISSFSQGYRISADGNSIVGDGDTSVLFDEALAWCTT